MPSHGKRIFLKIVDGIWCITFKWVYWAFLEKRELHDLAQNRTAQLLDTKPIHSVVNFRVFSSVEDKIITKK